MPLVLLLLVIAIHLWLVWVGPLPGDHWALRQASSPHPTWVRDYANFFQHLGTPVVAIPLAAVALLLILSGGFLTGSREHAAAASHEHAAAASRERAFAEARGLAVACLAVPLNAILKLVFGPSPLWVTVHHSGHNYPSGHTTFVVAVVGYIGVIAWRHDRRWLGVLAALFVIGVGPARVVTGIHLVSDVIGGYLLGAAMLLLALRTTGRAGLVGAPPKSFKA